MRTRFFDDRHLLFVTTVVLLVAGVSAFLTLPRLEDPRIVNRNPLVITQVPGVSADRVESQVTENLERSLQEIAEIKTIESTSRPGISLLRIELDDDVVQGQNDRLFSRIRDELADAEPLLPPEARPPILDDQRQAVAFTLIVGLTWEAGTAPRHGLLTRLATDLADRLRSIDGTDLVRLYGDVEEEIRVTIDEPAITSLGLRPDEVAALLAGADAKVVAGTVRADGTDLRLEVDGAFETLDRIRSIPLIERDGRALALLGDVGDVERRWTEPPRELGLTDGERTVLVAARMDPAVQISRWSGEARAAVEDLRSRAGGGIGVRTIFDQSVYTIDRLEQLGGNLLMGAAVVLAVIMLTMGLRSAMLVGLALPLTVAATLFGILLLGGQLHQMSIFGMIIGLGLLIDNAIVMVDEIRKRREAGLEPRAALSETIRHLASPLFASTLTTALAFAPIVLLPGNAGDFVGPIAMSVILAIVSSYAISLTVIGAFAARYGRFAARPEDRRWWRHGLPSGDVGAMLERWLARGLRMPMACMMLAAVPPTAGFALGPHLGRSFFPPTDRDMFDVRLWMPEGSSLDRTRAAAAAVEAAIREHGEIEHVHWLIGGSFPSVYYNLTMSQDGASDFAQGVVDATTAVAVAEMIPELQSRLDERFPGLQIVLRSFGQGPPVDADVSLRLTGDSIPTLQRLGERVRRVLQAHPDVLHTRTSLPHGRPTLRFDADEHETRFAGLMLSGVADQLRGRLDGVVGGSVVESLEELPVRVRVPDEQRSTVEALGSASLPGPGGTWIPLASLGSIALAPEAGGVTRYDRVRCNTIDAYTRSDALPIDVTLEVLASLEEEGFELPPGFALDLGGSLEQDQDAIGNLAAYAPVLATIMLATLILTFGSVAMAAILLGVGGLSVGLALLATWSIGFPVSFNTILGTLGLIGVAFNDSIVVLAAIREDPRAAAGDPRAIARAVLGCGRHVLSTTLTTIGGFLPLLLFVGGEFWPSLAIVLAGGVGGATVLATLFVPAAHALITGSSSNDPSSASSSASDDLDAAASR